LNQVGEAPDLLWRDPKTALQELSMKEFGEWPRYQDIGSEGPPNDRTFSVSVSIRGTTIATGVGRKKKAAQQNAAREALERISLGWLPGNPEVGPDE
jgi:ribonuclease-3